MTQIWESEGPLRGLHQIRPIRRPEGKIHDHRHLESSREYHPIRSSRRPGSGIRDHHRYELSPKDRVHQLPGRMSSQKSGIQYLPDQE